MEAIVAALLVAMVTFTASPPNATCAKANACALPPATIYVNRSVFGYGKDYREVLRHELGHVFDYQYMTDGTRNRFRSLMHDPRPWRTAPNSPHEQFAEAFGMCTRSVRVRVYGSEGDTAGGYGYNPSEAKHRSVCRFIQRVFTSQSR